MDSLTLAPHGPTVGIIPLRNSCIRIWIATKIKLFFHGPRVSFPSNFVKIGSVVFTGKQTNADESIMSLSQSNRNTDDIALFSVSWSTASDKCVVINMVNSGIFLFNPIKSQLITFGGSNPTAFETHIHEKLI